MASHESETALKLISCEEIRNDPIPTELLIEVKCKAQRFYGYLVPITFKGVAISYGSSHPMPEAVAAVANSIESQRRSSSVVKTSPKTTLSTGFVATHVIIGFNCCCRSVVFPNVHQFPTGGGISRASQSAQVRPPLQKRLRSKRTTRILSIDSTEQCDAESAEEQVPHGNSRRFRGQQAPRAPVVPKKYEFEQIIADRISSAGKEYLVKWKGYVLSFLESEAAVFEANFQDTRAPKTPGSQRKIYQYTAVKNMNLINRSQSAAILIHVRQ